MPIGTSTSPLRFTLPVSAKTLVPLLVPEPIAEYASAPLRMIHATLANVSTLLMLVGLPHSPDVAGKGGRTRGMPRWPSSDAMSAVSSPQTNAPAPSLTWIVKSKPVPMMSLPRSPRSSACAIAMLRRLIASGYSARQ